MKAEFHSRPLFHVCWSRTAFLMSTFLILGGVFTSSLGNDKYSSLVDPMKDGASQTLSMSLFKMDPLGLDEGRIDFTIEGPSNLVDLFRLNRADSVIEGIVKDSSGTPISGVTVRVKDTETGTVTESDGKFELEVPEGSHTLIVSSLGFVTQEVDFEGSQSLEIVLQSAATGLDDVVVIGYTTQKRGDITAAISSITSEDIEKVHGGSTVSTALAGKVSGLSFRMSEGRPGSSAGIQIRNMGAPLFVIDGVVKDEGQFNNLSPNDIASIDVLKDASAAVYGVRAANGVILVTTKHGQLDQGPKLSIDAYTGWQNLTRYPNDVVDAYHWQKYAAEARVNQGGSPGITDEELKKWKEGTEPGFKSFDWANFIFQKNAPQSSVNASVSGGGKNTKYYFSATKLSQDAVFKQYKFERTNFQANITSHIGENLELGIDLNGRIETRVNPGVPGGDDYFEPLFATMRNTPMERPYANDNPDFLNDIGHNNDNAALWTYDLSGKFRNDWRVLQTNFHGIYDLPFIEGLSAGGSYSYYYANNYLTNHEFTYDAYTYDPNTDTYNVTGGSSNPWQERGRRLVTEIDAQGKIDYKRSFNLHNVSVTLVTEWYKRLDLYSWQHNVPPVNELDHILQPTIDNSSGYNDDRTPQARISYVGQLSYNYASKYYLEFSGREDGSWMWPPQHRWGFFPSLSLGWRITEEPFFKSLISSASVLSDLKIRGSWGRLGDDNTGIDPFAYIQGYNFPADGPLVIFNGNPVTPSVDRGVPITNISWFTSTTMDLGVDFVLFNNRLTGSFDYFHRKRTGLLASATDVLIPDEIGYSLPLENANSDEQRGGEFSISYKNNIKDFKYTISGNLSLSRSKFLHSHNPLFGNSWDRYRNSGEERWDGIFWGYQVVGQFKSQDEINEYPVNIDGQGNRSLLPGDFIYADVNGDGVIDDMDVRPIGYNVGGQPNLFGGLSIVLSWKNFDFTADFSYMGMYAYNRNWEGRWPFQNGGSLLKEYTDRWHREDEFDLNSEWVSGKYPPMRFNDPAHSNYNKDSDWWLVNINAFRARTLQLGYTLPKDWTDKVKIERVRVYLNAYNLFTIDNLKKQANFLDPEVIGDNSLQYPQSKFFNVGINIDF